MPSLSFVISELIELIVGRGVKSGLASRSLLKRGSDDVGTEF